LLKAAPYFESSGIQTDQLVLYFGDNQLRPNDTPINEGLDPNGVNKIGIVRLEDPLANTINVRFQRREHRSTTRRIKKACD
jgi:hypothetical protein